MPRSEIISLRTREREKERERDRITRIDRTSSTRRYSASERSYFVNTVDQADVPVDLEYEHRTCKGRGSIDVTATAAQSSTCTNHGYSSGPDIRVHPIKILDIRVPELLQRPHGDAATAALRCAKEHQCDDAIASVRRVVATPAPVYRYTGNRSTFARKKCSKVRIRCNVQARRDTLDAHWAGGTRF
jgi:hypothetical protein